MKRHSYQQLAGAALLAGLGFAAVAQTPPPAAAPGAPVPAMRDGQPAMERGMMQQRRAERQARRLAVMKQKLGITAAQEDAWTAWTAAMQPPQRRMQRPDRLEFETLTTPERIDRARALRAERIAIADRRGEATKAFYAALNPEQRKLFDEMSLRMGKRGGGQRGHHGGFGRG